MKAREVIRIIKSHGGEQIRQRGSHRFFQVTVDGVKGHTTVSGKDAEDIPSGLLGKIQRDLENVLGKGWLR